jgi:hypothetical protein
MGFVLLLLNYKVLYEFYVKLDLQRTDMDQNKVCLPCFSAGQIPNFVRVSSVQKGNMQTGRHDTPTPHYDCRKIKYKRS